MTRVAIGFGSNVGDRRAHLTAALKQLAQQSVLVSVSSLYESAPVGPVEQGPFLNSVAVIETELPPRQLLNELLAIEEAEGRVRTERWGPRTLDLDMLLYGDERLDFSDLQVPHPELAARRFVLDPLLEAWPDAALPDGSPVRWLRQPVEDQEVERLGPWVTRWRRIWWRLSGAGSRRNLVA